jgi:ribosomal protein S18 acetylase RimI-like enzyme
MRVRIDPMVSEDYDEVLSLWKATEGIELTESDSRQGVDTFLKRNPGMSFVARDGVRLVGAILCGHDGRRGYLNHLAVENTRRRQGIGKDLVKHCVSALKRQGIIGCNLFILDANTAGRRFWESQGWTSPEDWGVMNRRFG